MDFSPADLDVRDRYKLLIGCVVPRPIAWVSTVSPDGAPNLAPFSFFNAVGSNPMTLVFCPGNAPDGSDKDTLRNCKPRAEGGTGEFVVHVVDAANARRMAATAEPLPYGDSEIELAGVETVPSRRVAPPRVVTAPAAFECRTLQVIRTNPGERAGGNLVLGEVVYIHLADGLVDERMHVDSARLAAIGRLGGADYCTTADRFSMPRGRAALEPDGSS